MKDPIAALADRIYQWRWFVMLGLGAVVGIVSPILAPTAANVLQGASLSIAGTDSAKADQILGDDFNSSSTKNLVILFRSKTDTVDSASFKDAVTTAASDASGVSGVKQVTTYYDHKAESLVSADRHATMAVVVTGSGSEAQAAVPKLRDKLKGSPIEAYVMGDAAAAVDGQAAAIEDLHRSELVTLPLIIILLLLVFRTVVSAVVPLVLGGASIGLSVSLIGQIGSHVEVSVFALNVGTLLGLGLAIDYCLIVLSRYREELAMGQEPRRALQITMATAGRSILYSGLTVVIAMSVVTFVLAPIVVIRSISLAVAVVALLAIVLSMTLLPALMAVAQHRLEWLRVVPKGRQLKAGQHGMWYRFSRFIMDRPVIWLAASLVVLLGIASPLINVAFGSPTPASGTPSATATSVLKQEFPAGRVAPIYIVVKSSASDGVWTADLLGGVVALDAKLKADDRVSSVDSLRNAFPDISDSQFTALTKSSLGQRLAQAGPYVNTGGNNDATVITVVSKQLDSDPSTTALLSDIRGTYLPSISGLKSAAVYTGGLTATTTDFKQSLVDRFPLVALAVGLIILLILMMFFQSVALPIKAVVMNLISIAALFGVLSIVFQHGVASGLLGFTSTDYITVISPGILYVIVFALSTDYEVFMLSRVKEYFQKFGNNEEAVAAGLQHTAGIITAAGAILMLTFGSFLVSTSVVLKEIGLGLAAGVLLDSTVVRVIMVPATMRLLGNGNWWMPGWLKRIIPEISEQGAVELADYTDAAPPPAGAVATAPALAAAAAAVPVGVAGTETMVMPAGVGGPGGPLGTETMVMTARPLPSQPVLGPASLIVSGVWEGPPTVPLSQDHSTRFGRLDSNEIPLPSLAVSRWHARIDYIDGQYHLTDLNSLNGVYVNGARIAPRPSSVILHPGDNVLIGGFTRTAFTFRTE